MKGHDINLDVYNDPAIVEEYVRADGLRLCESFAFEAFIKKGDSILDLGVGGGRTTPHLVRKAARYVGTDYAQSMVAACRRKFPSLEFACEDATDLQRFAEESFDVVVFSDNGIDMIRSDEARARCFREVERLLRPGGRFIFSSHNAKSIGFTAHTRRFIFSLHNGEKTGIWPNLRGRGLLQILWRVFRSIGRSAAIQSRRLQKEAAHKGTGYILDSSHGGIATFVSTPESIATEAKVAGLRFVEKISSVYPKIAPPYLTPFYYYIMEKPCNGSFGKERQSPDSAGPVRRLQAACFWVDFWFPSTNALIAS
jgi:ubiquinone/menaquinone biosynthesis C-methylase UbiE